MKFKTVVASALLAVLAGLVVILAVEMRALWLTQHPEPAVGESAGAKPLTPPKAADASAGTPTVPLQPWQQALLQQARSGNAPSMRRLARSLIGDTASHIDAATALFWAQRAEAAGDRNATRVVRAAEAYLRQGKPEDRTLSAALAPSAARQAYNGLLDYAAAHETCTDKRGSCAEAQRALLAQGTAQLQAAWRQVIDWPQHAEEEEVQDARRASAYLQAFGLEPFGITPERTPWRAPDDPLKGRKALEELAAGGALQDKLMLAYALVDSPAPGDADRARALMDEISQASDPKKLSELRYSLLDQAPRRGWTRRAHQWLFPSIADPTSHYLRRAADAGAFNESQTLGLAYFFGGPYFAGLSQDQWDIAAIPQDHVSAMKYLERAQASNRRESEAVLGGLLLSGNGVAHDYPRGLTLLREAAEQGSFWALGSLAQIYANGSFGVEKSPAAGYTLANIAVRLSPAVGSPEQLATNLDEAGIEMARTALASLQDTLLPQQLSRAQEASRTWMPGARLPTAAGNRGVIYGTGVFISSGGDMLTNAHVVKGCKTVRLTDGGAEGSVARVDATNDLALVRFANVNRGDQPLPYVRLRSEPPNLGEPITVFGFPLVGPLSAAGNVTNGIVSSESGFEDNSLQFQFTAPVQSGSSGGPVLDSKGRLVGVIIGKLNAELTQRATGEAPQNANFGIKNIAVVAFLRGAAVDVGRPSLLAMLWSPSPEDLARDARNASRRVECAP